MTEKTPVKCCMTCGHAVQKDVGIIGQWVGECKALPPAPVTTMKPNGAVSLQWVWPIVDNTVCCGQYRPKN